MGRGIGDGMLGYFFVFLAGDARSLLFSLFRGKWTDERNVRAEG